MPPWLPELGFGDFQDERRLTSAQIQTILTWVNGGEQQGSGSPPSPPALPENMWTLDKPDLIVSSQKPFTTPGSGSDIFWNFSFNPALSTTRYCGP
jgi:hypothetical protein